jgi:Spy/CpxP family protein refolding chaperone
MNIRKNAEAIFLAAAIVGTFVSYATAAESVSAPVSASVRFTPAPVAAKAVAGASPMQVVVIKGHRLNAAQKAALN